MTLPGEIRSFGISFMLPQSVTPAGEEGDFEINFGVAIDNLAFQLVKKPKDCKLAIATDATATANSGSGTLQNSQTLFAVNGSGGPSEFSIYYNSFNLRDGSLGPGWTHTYDISLQVHADGAVSLLNGNSSRLYTYSSGTYAAEPGDYSTLQNTGAGWLVTAHDGTRFAFDSSGVLSSITDRSGRTRTLTYSNGDMTAVSDSSGHSVTLAYDTTSTPHRLMSVADPANNTYGFQYQDDRLSRLVNPLAESGEVERGYWEYSYNDDGYLASKKDPNGALHRYEYYDLPNGRLKSTVDPDGTTDPVGHTKSFDYSAISGTTGVTTFTEKDGGIWLYQYDISRGVLTWKSDPQGNTTSYNYDTDGNLLTKTEPGIGTTSYTYDNQGNVTSVTDPLNQITTNTYNGFGQVLTVTGAPGNIANSYDATGNLLATTGPSGATTQFGYDGRGNLTSITDPRGKHTSLAYDAADNLNTVTLPTGAVTRFSHDASGNILTTTDAVGKVTSFGYDAMNRLTIVTDPLGHVTQYAYDKNGNRTSTTDANGRVTARSYNYRGQLTELRDALNSVTAFSYGAAGCPSCSGVDQLTGIIDARGNSTTWRYDTRGRLLAETDPLNNSIQYGYSQTSQPTSRTDATGATTGYTYDALGRLTQKTWPDATTETYTYDSRNNILTLTNPHISYTYSYDGANRVTSVSDSRGYTISYQYDQNGNRIQMTHQPGTADEQVIGYSYDDSNRPSTLTSLTGSFSFGHDLLDRRTSLAYPNGVITSYSYDDAGRLTGISHGTIASYFYTLDNAGNRTSKAAEEQEQYLYDPVYRILDTLKTEAESFSFDAVGNRLTGPGTKDTAYLYNAGNQLLEGRTLHYSYDANGNQTARIVPGATDKSWTLEWDYENQLTKVEKIKGSERRTVTFKYDPFGRRIEKKTETVIDGTTKTVTTTNVYDNEDIVLAVTTDGATMTTTRYIHGPGIDEPLAMERNGSYYYYHTDGLGSVTAITDQNRAVVQTYGYDTFGTITAVHDPGFVQPYTYTGREWDRETGLYCYRARYYDPMEGRFISKDPIGFDGGINLYSYVQDNPVNRTDPMGLMSCNGTWVQVGYNRNFNFACSCYWLCIPCDGPVIWSGNLVTLPTTHGTMVNSGNVGGTGVKSGDACLCNKPGPEKDCCKK